MAEACSLMTDLAAGPEKSGDAWPSLGTVRPERELPGWFEGSWKSLGIAKRVLVDLVANLGW